MKKIFIALTLALMLLPFFPTKAADNPLEVYIFTETGCPYCAKTLSHLEDLKKSTYPNMVVTDFDLRRDPKYFPKYQNFAKAYKLTADAVPMTYIGDKGMKGAVLDQIDSALQICKTQQCQNPDQFVTQYLKDNPGVATPDTASGKSVVGYVILGLIVVAGIVIYINKA